MKWVLIILSLIFPAVCWAQVPNPSGEPVAKLCITDLGGCGYYTTDENNNNALYLEPSLYKLTTDEVRKEFNDVGFRLYRADNTSRLNQLTQREESEKLEDAHQDVLDKGEDYVFSGGICFATGVGCGLSIGSFVVAPNPLSLWATRLTCAAAVLTCAQTRILYERWQRSQLKYQKIRDEFEAKHPTVAPSESSETSHHGGPNFGGAIGSDGCRPRCLEPVVEIHEGEGIFD